MRYLRTNTATRVTVGPFLDKTDGITPEVALTVTSEKLTLMVDTGGVPTLILDTAPTASGGSNDMVHVTNDDAGFYDLELAAADVNYLGRALLSLNDVATHCPVFHEFMILPANVYDSLILGTDLLDASAAQFAGQTVTCSGGVTVPAATLASTANITSASGVSLAADQAVNVTKLDGVALSTHVAGMIPADVRDIVGAAVSATTAQLGVNVVQISADATAADNAEAFFDGTGYAGTNNTLPWNAAWDAEVQSECNDALIALGLDTVATSAQIADAVWDEAIAGHAGAGSTGLALSGASAPTAATVADAVWDEARAGHVAAGSFGEGVVVTTNSDKTGYGIGVGGIAATAFAANAVDAAAAAADFGTEMGAAVLAAAVATPIDANVQKVNDVTLTGNGSVGTPWGPV